MDLSKKQKIKIDEILLNLDESLTFEEKHEELIDICLDEDVFNLYDDDEGYIFEKYSNLVWDYMMNK
jgi:hypothetical protein